MANYQGVCLTAPAWRFVNLDIANRLTDHEDFAWESQPADLGDLSRKFAPYLGVPSLAAIAARSDRWLENSLRPLILLSRAALDQLTQHWELPRAIGVCHGHALPRSIRPLLPLWFERRRDTGLVPVHCVGVPVAAILGWIAGNRAEFPLRTFIVSGTSQVMEVSAVRASIDAGALSIQMDWTCELSQTETPARWQGKLARMVRSLSGKTGGGEWRLDSFSSLPWIVNCLNLLSAEAATAGIKLDSEVRSHDELELARGAACHAAFQQTQQLPNAVFSTLNYADVCVRDVGLMGQGREGQYWHTLFPAGHPLPAASARLRIRGACPPAFQLFEYTGDGIPSIWNTADEPFLKQVRWYGSGLLNVPRETQPECLVIRIPTDSSPDNIPPPRAEVSSATDDEADRQ